MITLRTAALPHDFDHCKKGVVMRLPQLKITDNDEGWIVLLSSLMVLAGAFWLAILFSR